MKTIWKFPLNTFGAPIPMPMGAKVLHVAEQAGMACLWAEVDATGATEHRRFLPVGTGHPLPTGDLAYVGSVLMHDGGLVLHFYEMI